jgi:hypothetical protein
MSEKQSPIFTKTYDFCLWILNHTEKFPKSERFRLAKRMEDTVFQFYDKMISATRSKQPAIILAEADLELQKMRLFLRLSHDRKLTSMDQYQYASGLLVEIGKLLGGWIGSLSKNVS